MKIKVKNMKYEDVLALPKEKYYKPIKQHMVFRALLKLVSSVDLFATRFKCRKIGMEKSGKDEPCLILMDSVGSRKIESVLKKNFVQMVCIMI